MGFSLGQFCSRKLSEPERGEAREACRLTGRIVPALGLRKSAVSEHAVSWVLAFAGSEQARCSLFASGKNLIAQPFLVCGFLIPFHLENQIHYQSM